jgi:molybdopterin/thiamine biosynthesis adenylyltransferase
MGTGATVTSDGAEISSSEETRYDRQIRAFGAEGQATLAALQIGIVGLGGTGSVVAQQLAHLGVSDYLLLDPDTVEPSNLNRLVGAREADVGRPKVDVTGDMIRRINPAAAVRAATQSVLLASVAKRLADVDFLFCCTDSHGSRAVLNQVAFQYLLPAIDLGVAIVAHEGRVANIAGRVQMLAPGLPCLTCGNYLDAEQVRRDLLTDFERKADPYIVGAQMAQPAVISINSAVASLAVTMFLNAVTRIPGIARLLNYNGLVGAVRPAVARCHPTCVVCSSVGALARGNSWPLPARLD